MRAQIIEEERRRMLAEAARVVGIEHLPKGVLRDASDMAFFKQANATPLPHPEFTTTTQTLHY